jgi:hypothetical protein
VESRGELARRSFDLPGAITVTAGLSALVYALVRATAVGWGSVQTIGLLAVAAALLSSFVVIGGRSNAPLVPFAFFRNLNVSAGNATMFATGAAIIGLFYFTLGIIVAAGMASPLLYMQKVLGYSAIKAGTSQLPLGRSPGPAAGAHRGAGPVRRRPGLVRPATRPRQLPR